MKKALSLIIAAIFIASVLTACGASSFQSDTAAVSKSAKIRVTSSDGEDAAAWLSERLGESLTGRVAIGTDADGFGVSLDALEDDGYLIRTAGDETALLARTEAGLDRAARKYAKMVEAGSVADVTYHEGYRVGRIELAGRDISEYTVYYGDGKYMPAAAAELSALIAKACGASLAVSDAEPKAPYVSLRYVHDESLSTCGYRWSVTDDGLAVECSDGYMISSAKFAVERFVENELGWLGLTYGYESLAEAELISIPAGKSGGETNAFEFVELYGDEWAEPDRFDHDYTLMRLSGVTCCCHGLQNNRFAGDLSATGNWATDQPCYLDDEFLEVAYEDISEYIENKLSAGAVIGEDFCFVDIAAGDNQNWCKCSKCLKMYSKEESRSAYVVDWANRLTDALNEKYDGLTYGIFAYISTRKPPKTLVPNDCISVTYCFSSNCDTHTHDLKNCDAQLAVIDSFLEDWLAISNSVYVWYYGMDQSFMTISYVGTVRDDYRYFRDIGVRGIMWEAEDHAYSTGKVAKWLAASLTWNVDMTDEEFYALRARILEAMYGDGGAYVGEYCDEVAMIQRSGKCGASGYTAVATPTFTPKLIAPAFDTLFALSEAALQNVDTRMQELRMTRLSCACIYQGCTASYFDAYEAGDDARVAELSRRYELIETRLASFGIKLGPSWQYGMVVWDAEPYESDMEVMAWTSWKKNAKALSLDLPTKAMPERVAAILAGREG